MTPREDDGTTSSTIYEHIRGLIATGYVGNGERLPTVRQTATDFGASPGTAARAFKQLEQEQLIDTRRGGGTCVAEGVSPLPGLLVVKLREIAQLAQSENLPADDVHGALRTIWAAQT